jgi:hypothetical protein
VRLDDRQHVPRDRRRVDVFADTLQARGRDGPVGIEARVRPRNRFRSSAQRRILFDLNGERHELFSVRETVQGRCRPPDAAGNIALERGLGIPPTKALSPGVKADNVELGAQDLLETCAKLHDPVNTRSARSTYINTIRKSSQMQANVTHLG